MKVLFCSFCRTKQDPLFGLTADPDAYCICRNCLDRFSSAPSTKRLTEPCCFCATGGVPGFMERSSGANICIECVSKFAEEAKRAPAATEGQDGIEEILIDWPVYMDAAMDLIGVKVKLKSGELRSANFTTPPRLTWEMEKGKRNGDWADGNYFWHPDLIFVEELTEDRIQKAISHLWKNDLLLKAFRKCDLA